MAVCVPKIFVLSALFFVPWTSAAIADTVIMKDNERLKGVVVEDYNDRVVISTMDGEKEISKKKIEKIEYDLEEQNLTSLADFYQDRGMYKAAYDYYEQALKVNPDYKKAWEGMNYVSAFVSDTGRNKRTGRMPRMNEENIWRQAGSPFGNIGEEESLKKTFGFSFRNIKGIFEVTVVELGSPADRAGLKKGDVILALWGRSISYMQPAEVVRKLLSDEAMEVRLSISRPVTLKLKNVPGGYYSVIGAKLGYLKMDGLVVKKVVPQGASYSAGIKTGDLLISIQGESTRYMPMEKVESIIKSRKGETLSFDIKRDIVLWKKF